LYNAPRPSHGELVKRTTGWVSLIALGLALSGPVAAHARTKYTHPGTNKQAQKAAKDYNKQLHKTQKQQAKAQKKQMKRAKKQHRTTTKTTVL